LDLLWQADRESVASDEFSDVSSDSDIFHADVLATKTWITEEDKELESIDVVKSLLRARPLLPPDPQDPNRDYVDVQSGINFPLAHCAVKGCSWTKDTLERNFPTVESMIRRHVHEVHASEMQLSSENPDLMAYYCAAIAEQERENMPLIGPSIDRRVFKWLQRACSSETVQSLICFVCAQVKTHVASHTSNWVIKYHPGSIFDEAHSRQKIQRSIAV